MNAYEHNASMLNFPFRGLEATFVLECVCMFLIVFAFFECFCFFEYVCTFSFFFHFFECFCMFLTAFFLCILELFSYLGNIFGLESVSGRGHARCNKLYMI